jgi:hypothetical protein
MVAKVRVLREYGEQVIPDVWIDNPQQEAFPGA